jgi:signal transduction histidine kinase
MSPGGLKPFALTRCADSQADLSAVGQEIHDLIGHKLSLILLHANAMEFDAERVAERVACIRQAGAEAVEKLRSIVDMLCGERADDTSEFDADLRLTSLIAASRQAGLPVEAQVDELSGLSSQLKRALVCLVREALTNVHKHAGPTPTTVRVIVSVGHVLIEVRDRGPRGREPMDVLGARRGLRGMSELVDWLGGYLNHSRTADGGFCVRAVLPF